VNILTLTLYERIFRFVSNFSTPNKIKNLRKEKTGKIRKIKTEKQKIYVFSSFASNFNFKRNTIF